MRAGVLRQTAGSDGTNAGYFSSPQVQVGDGEQPAQVERTGQLVDRALVDAELGDQPVQHVGWTSVSSTSSRTAGSNRRRSSSRSMRLEQVLGDVLVDLEVLMRVTRKAWCSMISDIAEQVGQVRRDDVLERHEPVSGDTAEEPGSSSGGTLTRANMRRVGARVARS